MQQFHAAGKLLRRGHGASRELLLGQVVEQQNEHQEQASLRYSWGQRNELKTGSTDPRAWENIPGRDIISVTNIIDHQSAHRTDL